MAQPASLAPAELDPPAADDRSEEHVRRLSRAEAARARSAALRAVGGAGTVTELERADDGRAGYEVEVTLADGTRVVAHLDPAFAVIAD